MYVIMPTDYVYNIIPSEFSGASKSVKASSKGMSSSLSDVTDDSGLLRTC